MKSCIFALICAMIISSAAAHSQVTVTGCGGWYPNCWIDLGPPTAELHYDPMLDYGPPGSAVNGVQSSGLNFLSEGVGPDSIVTIPPRAVNFGVPTDGVGVEGVTDGRIIIGFPSYAPVYGVAVRNSDVGGRRIQIAYYGPEYRQPGAISTPLAIGNVMGFEFSSVVGQMVSDESGRPIVHAIVVTGAGTGPAIIDDLWFLTDPLDGEALVITVCTYLNGQPLDTLSQQLIDGAWVTQGWNFDDHQSPSACKTMDVTGQDISRTTTWSPLVPQ